MSEAWQALHDAGLPLAGPRSGTATSEAAMAAAVLTLLSGGPMEERESDALSAFLRAWQHHFPGSFSKALGTDAGRVEAWAAAHVRDVNRHLKLRRIAIESLSRVL